MLDLISGKGNGRVYTVTHTSVATAAAQDLFAIITPAGIAVVIHDFSVAKSGAGTNAMNWGHTTGAVASAGGTAVTPAKHAQDMPAAQATYMVKNTTLGTVRTNFKAATIPASGTPWLWRLLGVGTLPHGDRVQLYCPPSSTLVLNGTLDAQTYAITAFLEEVLA